jgi:hypothetical protein
MLEHNDVVLIGGSCLMSIGGASGIGMSGVLSLFSIAVYFIMLGIGIYVLVLLIQVLRRAIIALDLYIDEKRNNRKPYV